MNQDYKKIPMREYRRLKGVDAREIKMRLLILQLASYMRRKKVVRERKAN